ncbi:MAG: hypothetical protein KHZ60_12815 [Alistipes sp.]|jgi:hypothetical protein|uniref:hypothetical protein n=1 Tax=Alistipes sp. TaxID=1872444 RepID=UPI001E0BD20E|nr:hypothetical protein [Alistipes sp.]MBS5020924.1 hypothetical protein [Alistipes sp.]
MMNGIKAGLELQKIAVSMGKIYKTLSVLSGKIQDGADVLNNKEDFYVLAYTCRVAILDRIQANDWIQMEIPIRIPTGLFSSRKETIGTGLNLTIGRLKELASSNNTVIYNIEEILQKHQLFYDFEQILPANIKDKL